MSEAERLLTEIRDLERKVVNERRSTRAEKSSGRRRSDRKRLDLNSALFDSFPGSDAVSFLEPAPTKPTGTN